MNRLIEPVTRLLLLGLLIVFCIQIVSPFLEFFIWGVILATAVHPVFEKLAVRCYGRQGLAAGLMVVVALSLLIIPVYQLGVSVVESSQSLVSQFEAGTLKVPPPNDSVKSWPVVGEQIFQAWSLASSNLQSLVLQYRTELSSMSQWLLGFATGIGQSVIVFILSIFVAGGFLAYASVAHPFLVKVVDRLIDDKGHHFVDLGTQTVRSVAQGVIGVALIQAIMAGLGLVVMDVPFTGIWVIVVLVLAVVQLPPIIILGPIMVYLFSTHETLPAVLFMVYGMIVSSSDAFLKPLFLGRGMDIPMPVILIGAIGGVIMMGILGLFIGAVVLAFGYSLFVDWLNTHNGQESDQAEVVTKDKSSL